MTGTRKHDSGNWYCIRVKGALDAKWADWFGGLTLKILDNDETILTGSITDQAALHGILAKIRDLGLILLVVQTCEEADQHVCARDQRSSLDREA